MLIDTHCHLTYEGLGESQADVLARAHAVGVERVITIGTDSADHLKVLQTIEQHPQVFAAIGIHPHHACETMPGVSAYLEQTLTSHPKILAVGECGLDYFRNRAPKEQQRRIFEIQIQLAGKLNKPLILHVRDAHADALAMMKPHGDLRFVVHCFTGTPRECRAWLDLGAYIGITGIVTYKNAPDVREDARLVPMEKLLVETDAPYLSPEPVRKIKINEPAHVAHVAKVIAGLRNMHEVDFAQQTTANAAHFFGDKLLQLWPNETLDRI